MARQHLSDEVLLEAVELINRHGNAGVAARAANIPYATLYNQYRIAASRGLCGYAPVLPGFQIKSTSVALDADGNKQREWIQQKQEPGEQFELPDGHVVKGISALVDRDDRVVSKWVKTKVDAVTPDLVAALKEVFSNYQPAQLIPAPASPADERLLSVYPIADQHHGMLAWGRETGADYDIKIGSDRLRSCMQRLVSRSPPSKQAIILNLGDWQHTDDNRNVTPQSKHGLDVDSRYFKILTSGVKLMIDCIDLAAQRHETVLVRNLPGNHDPHASIALTVALSAFYTNNPRITIDLDPSEFFFYRFGTTLIGANHGHKVPSDRMAIAMAVRCREDWGATKFHWFLSGHIHQERVREVGDVRVESFQSLASPDSYAAGSAYTAGHSLVSITLDRDDGEIDRLRVNVAPMYKPTACHESIVDVDEQKRKRKRKLGLKRKVQS